MGKFFLWVQGVESTKVGTGLRVTTSTVTGSGSETVTSTEMENTVPVEVGSILLETGSPRIPHGEDSVRNLYPINTKRGNLQFPR